MEFKKVFDQMVFNRRIVRRKEWKGYWYWNNGSIKIVNNGETTDIRETRDVSFIIRSMLENDWEVGAEKIVEEQPYDEDDYCDFEGNYLG